MGHKARGSAFERRARSVAVFLTGAGYGRWFRIAAPGGGPAFRPGEDLLDPKCLLLSGQDLPVSRLELWRDADQHQWHGRHSPALPN